MALLQLETVVQNRAMDLGGTESESTMARTESSSEVGVEDMSQEDSQATGTEEKHSLEHATGTSDGSSGVRITSMEELSNSIELGNLSQVEGIYLIMQDIGSGHFTLAEALASGEMCALEDLYLFSTGLVNDRCEAICNALISGKFPSLTRISFADNHIGTKGVEALSRAIQSGNLARLACLRLYGAGINDTDMALLGGALQYGEANVLPNLRVLNLSDNAFTEVGMQYLAEALQSGRLDSLENLRVHGCSKAISEEGANALVTALMQNNRLIVDVGFEWEVSPTLDRRRKQLRRRNIRQNDIVAALLSSPKVPAAFGKIYLCGNPKVGKTTLSRTLQRTFFEALRPRRWRPRAEERTRGIDVSQISSKGTQQQTENPLTLLVWDMAGQKDYHLVHHAFFPDLSFSEGKATTFIIVCTSKNLDKSKQQLKYWLRYIASSCDKTIHNLRHVFVVLNIIGGDKKVMRYEQDWEKVLQDERDKFKGFLEVRTDLFLVDVRKRGNVQGLKKCLLEHSRHVLSNEQVPSLCQIIQKNLTTWSDTRKQFPVVHWEEFVHIVCRSIAPWSEEVIEAATKYLNEVGVLIHVDKRFNPEWNIPDQRLVVLDPNWIFRELVGNIFLSEDMVNQREGKHLFREEVDSTTGSILISDFKKFFKSLLGEWSESQFDDLITILLWLGLCYKGRDQNVFIPALIDKNGQLGDPWQPPVPGNHFWPGHDEGQWVMGFSIKRKNSEVTLAPMSLWHRFQVELAQSPKFNGGEVDNDFIAGGNFMTFTVDYMNVLIQVDASEDIPTFDEISIFVKPKFRKEELDARERKQCQVNLAKYLVDILLGLWDDICGGVQYVHKVVWPWLASQSRPEYILDRNVEVAQIKKLVQMHGMGRKMQWTVGDDSAITEDQLLSTNDKRNMMNSVESDVNILKEGMREAVKLRIYPPALTEEFTDAVDGSEVAIQFTNVLTDRSITSDWTEEATQPMSPTTEILKAVKEVGDKVDKVFRKLSDVENILQEGFTMVLNEQKKVVRRLQDTQRFFKEDKDRTCPNLIYLGEKDSGVWATLKQALSPAVYVRLRFACEAKYNNYRPHEVRNQKGLDVSSLRPSVKKIVPWLKVSLTILFISAKVGAIFVAPGVGLILPDFQQWQEASSLSEGIEWATGFQKAELDKVMIEGMGLHSNDALWNPRDVYGKSREAITNLIGKLSPEGYEQNFGLRKVCLRYRDGSLHGVVWICTECLRNFMESDLVSEI